jgi:hypothetical protein
VRWLPTESGQAVPGDDVIYIPGLESELARVLGQDETGFVGTFALADEILDHPAFPIAAECCMRRGSEALQLLGDALSELPEYRIGDVELASSDPSRFLHGFLETFKSAPDNLIPSYRLIAAVCRLTESSDCESHLLPSLRGGIPVDRQIRILDFISSAHSKASSSQKVDLLEVYSWYLRAMVRTPGYREKLAHVRLLSKRGTWKSPSELCHHEDADGLDGDDVLDDRLARILPSVGIRVNAALHTLDRGGGATTHDVIPAIQASARVLRDYFADWSGAVPDETIGAFLVLLGDDPAILTDSRRFLERRSRSVEGVRRSFPWTVQERIFHGQEQAGHNEDIHAAMRKQRAMVKVLSPKADRVNVPNLIGDRFDAQLRAGEDIDSLFIRSGDWVAPHREIPMPGGSFRVGAIQLRPITPRALPRSDLIRLLRGTARDVLRHWYHQSAESELETLWSELAKTGQLEIDVARRLILESAPMYLRQLAVNRNPKVAEILSQIDGARRRKAEDESAELHGQTVHRTSDRDIRGAGDRLQHLLQSDGEVQAAVLDAVRDRIERQYQYSAQSVPFEIFQNADDAVGELALLGVEAPLDELRHRFTVRWDEHTIAFAHRGRAINQFSARDSGIEVRGFDLDLEKMLVISASDKGLRPEDTSTGKFGFGFKTVFLVTDGPRVISGQLRFKIVGGVLPQLLEANDRVSFESEVLDTQRKPPVAGTLIELPLRQHAGLDTTRTLELFLNLAHVLLVFARNIKECDLRGEGGRTETLGWREKEIAPGLSRGHLRPSKHGDNGEAGDALVFRSSHGAILIGLNARGFARLSEAVPTIWVTAPTAEHARVGFAVNGDFDVDVGRSRLASSSRRNEARAIAQGDALGQALLQLADLANDWHAFREMLRLGRDVSPDQFWLSVWRLLPEILDVLPTETMRSEVDRLVGHLLCPGQGRGLARLYRDRSVVPTDLHGDFVTLTDTMTARFIVDGALLHKDNFLIASNWPVFRQLCAPGTAVSAKVASVLGKLNPTGAAREKVDLGRLIHEVAGTTRRVSADAATQFGSLITPTFLNDMDRGKSSTEAESLRAGLRELLFVGLDGGWHRVRELLLNAST